MTARIGKMLKRYRKDRKLTLQDVSERTGLSVSYLSLLERGLNSPTIENLNSICLVLDITLSSLIATLSETPNIVVKKEDRQTIFSGNGYMYESTTEGEHKMSGVIMVVKDNEKHDSTPHIADEIGYIIKGSMIVNVSGNDYPMNEGDCIYIEANQHHSYTKTCEEDCVSFWVYGHPTHLVPDVDDDEE